MQTSNLVPWDSWLQEIGRTRSTGYKWRAAGIVSVVNVFGKLYIDRAEISRWEQQAKSGKFAKAQPDNLHLEPVQE